MQTKIGERVSDKNLAILIESLTEYKKSGVNDPWIFSDGTRVEPLNILLELREYRQKGKF